MEDTLIMPPCQALLKSGEKCNRRSSQFQVTHKGDTKNYCGMHSKLTITFLRQQIRDLKIRKAKNLSLRDACYERTAIATATYNDALSRALSCQDPIEREHLCKEIIEIKKKLEIQEKREIELAGIKITSQLQKLRKRVIDTLIFEQGQEMKQKIRQALI